MVNQPSTSPNRIAIIICGFIFGLVEIASAQSNQVLDFSGTYISDSHGYQESIYFTNEGEFKIADSNGNEVSISVNRLVDLINVIDVSTYFYEITVIPDGEKDIPEFNRMEVVYNSSNDYCFLELRGNNIVKRISRI